MSTTRTPRITLTLDDETRTLLQSIGQMVGMSEAAIINKLLLSNMEELWNYRDWLAKQPEGSKARILGANLMVNYGPESLLAGIKTLDPAFQSDAERFEAAVKAAELDPQWLADVHAAVAAKKVKE